MHIRHIPYYLFPLLLALPLAGEQLRVGVSVLPLESLVEDIGGEAVEAFSLQREGDSCSVFEPRPSVVSWISGADLFFRTGVPYEAVVMDKLQDPSGRLQIHDLREAVELLDALNPAPAHHHSGHGETCTACAGAATGTDPHIWMDPRRIMEMADFMAARMGEAVPEQRAAFEAGAEALKERAKRLDGYLEDLLEPYSGEAFFMYHPALQYFADRYHLRQVAIAGGSGAPSAKELHARIREAREKQIKVIFVQPQESRKHAGIVAAAVGASLVEVDPMAPGWETNLRLIGETLAEGLARNTAARVASGAGAGD